MPETLADLPPEMPHAQHARHLVRLEGRRSELRPVVASAIGAAELLVLEIGCGHGHFLTAYATAHPGECCLGVDIASDRIARANRKRERAGLANLRFVRADAGMLLDVLPPSIVISAVFILFPDPWPKLRHHKHRIVQPEFLSRLAGRLDGGGRIYFRTDHAPYFESVCAQISAHPQLMLADESWLFEYPTVFQIRAVSYFSLVAMRRDSAR